MREGWDRRRRVCVDLYVHVFIMFIYVKGKRVGQEEREERKGWKKNEGMKE